MPYQLHCCAQACKLLDEPIDDDEGLDDETTGTEDGVEEDVGGVPEHTVPLIVGLSSAPPFLFNWKPKLIVWPG